MEISSMEHHKKHFNQAHSTLFASGQSSDLLGYCRDTEFAKELRDGAADIESIDTDHYNKEFLEELQHKPTDPPKIAT
eukprot:3533904-Ditylum_brightwellii.AAC.1